MIAIEIIRLHPFVEDSNDDVNSTDLLTIYCGTQILDNNVLYTVWMFPEKEDYKINIAQWPMGIRKKKLPILSWPFGFR